MKKLLLEDCCEILDSMRIPITASERKSGSYPYYGANGIQDYVADYIYKHHGALPGGDDPAVRNKVWGISYAYYPVVSYMVSALFMRISTPPKVCLISPNIFFVCV